MRRANADLPQDLEMSDHDDQPPTLTRSRMGPRTPAPPRRTHRAGDADRHPRPRTRRRPPEGSARDRLVPHAQAGRAPAYARGQATWVGQARIGGQWVPMLKFRKAMGLLRLPSELDESFYDAMRASLLAAGAVAADIDAIATYLVRMVVERSDAGPEER